MKASELIDEPLNFAVARALGERPHIFHDTTCVAYLSNDHNYSEDWSQGGPIIEREKIDLVWQAGGYEDWTAYPNHGMNDEFAQCGPTPLIAAMRAYVASRLGDEVEIPEELLK